MLGDPSSTMTGGLNSGLANPGSKVGMYIGTSEEKGFMLEF